MSTNKRVGSAMRVANMDDAERFALSTKGLIAEQLGAPEVQHVIVQLIVELVRKEDV